MARIHRRTIHKKDLHNPDNHDGVITNLESDMTEGLHSHFQQKQNILRRGGKKTQNYTEKIFTTQIITMV